MPLPDTFHFSQSSLQDYVDCQRRFQLRYSLMQPWPDLVTGDPLEFELHVQRGARLHQLAQQHTLGIDPERLTATIQDEVLARWWQTYLHHPPSNLPQTLRRAEVVVSAPLAGYRMMAKFDLLAVDPGERMVVVDWKAARTPPSRAILARRLQTRVYRYLAVEAGAAFNEGHSFQPEQVEMVYWFAETGGSTQLFAYDAAQHAAVHDESARLIREIVSHSELTWPLTPDERRCRFCNYRSLCERDVKPGFLQDLEDDIEPPDQQIDLEQVAEVEF